MKTIVHLLVVAASIVGFVHLWWVFVALGLAIVFSHAVGRGLTWEDLNTLSPF